MESDRIRRIVKYLFGMLFPIIISVSVSILFLKSVPVELIWATFILIIITSGLVPIYIFSEFIFCFNWKRKHKKVLKKSLVGIIKEDECNLTKTKFTPEYWQQLLSEEYQTKFISALNVYAISDEFVAIINPYGECYPEKNIHDKTTFKRIKEYVKNGGIFVSTAGCAFWYAWNKEIGKTSTAKEVYSYVGTILRQSVQLNVGKGELNRIELQPGYSLSPLQSLTETLTFDELGLLTTTGHVRFIKVFQNEEDKEVFGDIENIALGKYIFEFRAIRKPTQNFKPIIRATIPTKNKPIEIYPLTYIPYGKGKFIFTGMHMNVQPNELINIVDGEPEEILTVWTDISKKTISQITDEQPKMVYKALQALVEKEKQEYTISFKELFKIRYLCQIIGR